jgi:hypothetical protein|tara:strand:- start:298 stop:729 length:432 start_codon:yes stop_codon:yes gene_type:complete
MKKIILILVFLLLLAACKSEDIVFIDKGNGKIKVNVEIADSFEERTKGLMFREFLDENSGMLFVFDDEDYLSFWMKNTLIPLDMIFISEDFEIVDIKYAVPCEKDPCISYKSIKPAKYVLEVNGNFTIGKNIAIGNNIMNIKN